MIQRGDGSEIVPGATAEPDRRDNGVDEAVEAHKGALAANCGAAWRELLEGALSKHTGLRAKNACAARQTQSRRKAAHPLSK
jgi:hypothetical protein